MTETLWTGCYNDGWRNLIGEASFAHPAKIARGLVRRIYAHAIGTGYLKPGDVVCDPFGGIAGTALDAMIHGLNWRGVELEPRFVELAAANIADWSRYHPEGSAVIAGG